MAKRPHSQPNGRESATAPRNAGATRTAAARQAGQTGQRPPTVGARKDPHRRGSVTKPVRKTPWTAIISGGLILAGLIAVVLIVVVNHKSSSSTLADPNNRPTPVASPVAGKTIPDFSVKAKDGTMLTKENFVGKSSLVVFFASWCPHCQAEAPRIVAAMRDNPDLNVVFIGVGDKETMDDIYGFQQKFNLPVPTYADPTVADFGKAASAWGIYNYPSLFAVDKNGVVKDSDKGEVDAKRLNDLIAKAKG